ncbi:alpha/beta hydrolase-fold protein [Corynebacterium frankenforstense]
MRDMLHRASRRRSLFLAATAIPVSLATAAALAPAAGAQSALPGSSGSSLTDSIAPSGGEPERSPVRTEYPQIDGLPEGVSIDHVDWLTNRRIAIYIKSAAMPDKPIQVQMLLARDWHTNPEATFPEVWALDGLRAREDHSGWTIDTNIEQFYADKNVNVILPVGGESSFYSDWLEPDNGKHYMWETFLMDELIPVLRNGYRSNGERAVVGISMGGTAAVNLAERNPEMFKFVGSFSGYLDTTSPGMPTAIRAAQTDAGGYNTTAMWGPDGSQAWIDHDPKLGIEALKGKTVYVSAGSGKEDQLGRAQGNLAGMGLEVIARMTSETFVNRAKATGVEPVVHFRPSGVHSWEYWQFEMTQAWPYIAETLGVPKEGRGADCAPIGAIAAATSNGVIGSCVNNEYDAGENGEGKAQDFRGGTAYWSPDTGAHALFGAINARYAELGGANSWLGFPKTGELKTPDGVGRFVHFERGSIYWTPETGAHAIPGDMFRHWGSTGYEKGDLGYPTGEPVERDGGIIQAFQGGWLVRDKAGENHWVRGAIAEKYGEMDGPGSELGFPTSDEKLIQGGAFQEFENGNIYWSPNTGAHFIRYGGIFDAWGKHRWEQGKYGYPTEDHQNLPGGGESVTFEHGRISQSNGVVKED